MKILFLSMKLMSRSLHTFARFLLDGKIVLFRLCHPWAGMMELGCSVARRKAVVHWVTRSPHAVTVTGPLLQLFTPTCTVTSLMAVLVGAVLSHSHNSDTVSPAVQIFCTTSVGAAKLCVWMFLSVESPIRRMVALSATLTVFL